MTYERINETRTKKKFKEKNNLKTRLNSKF